MITIHVIKDKAGMTATQEDIKALLSKARMTYNEPVRIRVPTV